MVNEYFCWEQQRGHYDMTSFAVECVLDSIHRKLESVIKGAKRSLVLSSVEVSKSLNTFDSSAESHCLFRDMTSH